MDTENKDGSGLVHYTGTIRAKLEQAEGYTKAGKRWVRRKYLMHRYVGGKLHFFMFDTFDDTIGELAPKSEGTIYCNVFANRNVTNGKFFHAVNAIKWVPKGVADEKK